MLSCVSGVAKNAECRTHVACFAPSPNLKHTATINTTPESIFFSHARFFLPYTLHFQSFSKLKDFITSSSITKNLNELK
ncbi:hypothetical protein P8452_66372 [Trifolium repens]|nr:hypothetical protein P8452_66372 [Trifolium repens]